MPRHMVFLCNVWRWTTHTERKKCILRYKGCRLCQIRDGRSFQSLAPTHGLNRSVGRPVRKLGLPKNNVPVGIEARFPMFHLAGVSPHPSLTGLLFPIRIRHMVHRHILPLGALGTLHHGKQCHYRLCAKWQDYPYWGRAHQC